MLKKAIQKIVEGRSLTEEEAMGAMNCIMAGEATQAQIGSFMTALRLKGETIEEITGCAKAMREKADRISPEVGYSIDTCGTGGDGSNTFNISTAAAIVAAAAGVTVAKHGNRSVSSRSGSADVLEALGVNISLSPGQVKECIEKIGIGFMFAPTFHKSMKHAAGPRKELGFRTIFNMLGPLTNPAGVKGQVLGVFHHSLTATIANVLLKLNIERAMVIHGMDGLDEISTAAPTKVCEIKDGEVLDYEINPEELGLRRASKEELAGGDAQANAMIINSIFEGEKSGRRDAVLINAAAALYVGKAVDNIRDGIEMAMDIIDAGKAMKKLCEMREFTNSLVRNQAALFA